MSKLKLFFYCYVYCCCYVYCYVYFLSKIAIGVDVAIGFVYCYFYCLKWQNQAVDVDVEEGFGFSCNILERNGQLSYFAHLASFYQFEFRINFLSILNFFLFSSLLNKNHHWFCHAMIIRLYFIGRSVRVLKSLTTTKHQ